MAGLRTGSIAMKLAETVTFGGSGLDRAAHLRGDPVALETARLNPDARAILFWRDKPMLAGAACDQLARLPLDHPILQQAGPLVLFAGLEAAAPRFVYDLTGWTPTDQDLDSLGAFQDPSQQHHPSLPADHLFCELRARMWDLSPRDAELAALSRGLFSWHRGYGFCARCGGATISGSAGWQRSCTACGGSHFPRTDPVVIMLITHHNSVLLGRSPSWPEGMYSLLAGFVEPGETIEAAVRREVFEEAGVAVGEVGYLGSQPWPFPASLMLGCWGQATSQEITIDPVEIEDARWVTREEMAEVFADNHPEIRPTRKGAIAHFILHNWLADRLD